MLDQTARCDLLVHEQLALFFIVASCLATGLSFWSLNIGLATMVFVNLVPVGLLQFNDSLNNGYWHARTLEFCEQPLVRILEWARLAGDVLFIVGGIAPIVYLAWRMFQGRNRPAAVEAAGTLVERPAS